MSKKIEEYLLKEYPITKKDIEKDIHLSLGWALDFAEHYHETRVNAISDEMIDATGYAMSIKIEKSINKPQANAYANGMKDFKKLLLKE